MSDDTIIDRYPTLNPNHIRHATEGLKNFIDTIDQSKIDASYQLPCKTFLQENIHKFKKGSSWWSKSLKLNQNVIKNVRKREEKWRWKLRDSSLNREFWDTQYRMVNKIRFDNKIYITQFQIMKRNIKTNNMVHCWKNYIPESCTFGCNDTENAEHLFFKCPTTRGLIKDVNQYMPQWTREREFTTIKDFLFIERMKKLNSREVIKLMIKHYTWRSRCCSKKEDMNIDSFKAYLYNFMRPHKAAKSLDFLQENRLWTELNA